jgi:hypothetical protein
MTDITFKPELRTTGGEVIDIFQREKYLGTMTMVYRETDRLCGVVHLEDEQISGRLKEKLFVQLQSHVHCLVDALDLEQCEVLVFYKGNQYLIDLDSMSEPFTADTKHIRMEDVEDESYSVRLIRDDLDALTYEVLHPDDEESPLAIATIHIGKEQLSGMIDFREPRTSDERELVATLILEELDKERDYDKINLTMYVKNEYMDEILFETEDVH